MKNILLIVDSEGMYRQKNDQYESIDINMFVNELVNLGYKVDITNYFDVYNHVDNIKGQTIVYTSSQRLNYKKYIEDIIYELSKNNDVIPSYNSLIGHENKGYQEIQRKILNIDQLKSYVISDIKEIDKVELNYPIVIKRPSSCSGSGVYLAHDRLELNKIINKHFLGKDLNYYVLVFKKILKRIIRKKTYAWTSNKIKDYHFSWFILEEYIPDLDGDFKILVYGDKFYALKRNAKKGDFRASGSGLHDFAFRVPNEVLDFAKNSFEMMDIPFAGFDIAIDKNNKCYMIEFQSIHIGPITLMHSDKYFTNNNGKWQVHNEKSILEEEYARAIDLYIRRKK